MIRHKKTISFFLSGILIVSLCGCGFELNGSVQTSSKPQEVPTTLNVTTTWGGYDGGATLYQEYIAKYMQESGNVINDFSSGADETFKQRVVKDFEVGAEPDVLFYFNGSDANSFISAGKVVSLDTVREEYPDYASNMQQDLFVESEVDGEVYSVPAYGYWEGMFVNKKLCEQLGVDIPDANTDWDEFLQICRVIKQKGYTPIAVSLCKEPNYLFEFFIYNESSLATHYQIPKAIDDQYAVAWMTGLQELKNVYSKGYLSYNTLSASADETFQSFIDGEAAFLIDGSWKMGSIISSVENVDDFTVTFVPGKGKRRATDIIAGFSSGWYITKKAWDNPEKREAAVDFISYMTKDDVIADFASIAVSTTALKKGVSFDKTNLCQLQIDASYMIMGATTMKRAVQDRIALDCRTPLFGGMPDIVSGKIRVEDAMQRFIELCER